MKRTRNEIRKELEDEAVVVNKLNLLIPELHGKFVSNPNDEAVKAELTAAILQFQSLEAKMQQLIAELESTTE